MDKCASNNEARTQIIGRVAYVLREERATATNIELAVGKAGIDRKSVIAAFGSMHGLILEMVSDLSGALIKPLQQHEKHHALRDVLIEFGRLVVDAHSVSHLVSLYRIALTEATRHSGIGREFFERGPGKLTTCLAQYLARIATKSDGLQIDNPMRLADAFLSLLGDNLEIFDTTTIAGTPCAKGRSDAVIEAVEMFCRGVFAEAQ